MNNGATIPARVVEVRAEICARCKTPCKHQSAAEFQAAPCSACPINQWGSYGQCEQYQLPGETLRYRYATLAARPPEPTVAELAENFVGAMERWTAAGFPTVSADDYAQREVACEVCELWDGSARFGLGKCNAPGCGCTKFKRWLKTEQCKHPAGSRWPAVSG